MITIEIKEDFILTGNLRTPHLNIWLEVSLITTDRKYIRADPLLFDKSVRAWVTDLDLDVFFFRKWIRKGGDPANWGQISANPAAREYFAI